MGFRRHRLMLVGLAAALPAVEALVLRVVGFQAAYGLAGQVSAGWPYGIFHDLRWLIVYHRSWPGFAVGLLALIGFRGLLSAVLTALAWPAGVDRPALGPLVRRNIAVAALAAVLISPWAALAMAGAVLALSWFLFASVIPVLLLAPFVQRAGVSAGWWRGLPGTALVGWSLLAFAQLTVGGALIWLVGGWWVVPVAAGVGALNGLLWLKITHAAVLPRPVRWRRVPVAPLAILLVFTTPVAARFVVHLGSGLQGQWRPPIISEPLPGQVDLGVIAIAGHGSVYRGSEPASPLIEFFSYRGLDPRGEPLPYSAVDTHQSLERSAELLRAQVEALHRRSGRPLALVAQSEGALVARLYLAKWPDSQVRTVLLFSPLVRAGRAYYPPPQARSGWGIAGGWQLRGVFLLIGLTSDTPDSPDEPFVRSLLDNAPFYRFEMLCQVPGVRMVAFLPTVTAVEAPPGDYSDIPVFELPAFHGGLLGRPVVQDEVVDFLSGMPVERPRPEYDALQRLGAAWQAPPLAVRLNAVWQDRQRPDPAFGGQVCPPG